MVLPQEIILEIPEFEPIEEAEARLTLKKSLNDKLKGGLSIGLNDKLAFIKHLFNGSNADYERVLSQLNTATSFKDATHFINNIVKPDFGPEWQWRVQAQILLPTSTSKGSK